MNCEAITVLNIFFSLPFSNLGEPKPFLELLFPCYPSDQRKMSYLLPHLHSGWAVDQAILAEEERLVIIRFGHDWDETCMQVRPNAFPPPFASPYRKRCAYIVFLGCLF